MLLTRGHLAEVDISEALKTPVFTAGTVPAIAPTTKEEEEAPEEEEQEEEEQEEEEDLQGLGALFG